VLSFSGWEGEAGYRNGEWKMRHEKIGKVIYIEATLAVFFLYLLFSKGIVTFEESEENYFHVVLNGEEVGTLGEADQAQELLIQARREIGENADKLVLMDLDLSCAGEKVLWGQVDDEETVLARMKSVMENSIRETMHRSYTVKVNDYMVNLGDIGEVKTLLQAAVSKYDAEGKFTVELEQDSTRELNVLTAEVVSIEGQEKETEEQAVSAFPEAGIEAKITDAIASADPEIEKNFGEYELGILSMNFAQEVEIVETYLPESQLKPVEQAIEEVTKEQETVTTYEVVAGDTLSEISLKVNIPLEDLIAMNETLENENSMIRVGDELIITVPEPELSMEYQEEDYVEEVYDADVIYVDEDSWYTNQTQVLQQPSSGFRKVIAVTSYLDSKVVDREIIKEEIVMEAVPKIVKRGTRIPPTYIKPISGGRLSSGYGKRSRPTKGASTFHKGVDWAVPTGTAVYASCGGTVAKAGWGSGYGYVVYINHEDGRQTRYGHLSKVLVKAGQTVKQGEKIALSGNTGVSTGSHLHFEILINGVQKNPLNYLE
jgi:metallopeptidase M23 family